VAGSVVLLETCVNQKQKGKKLNKGKSYWEWMIPIRISLPRSIQTGVDMMGGELTTTTQPSGGGQIKIKCVH